MLKSITLKNIGKSIVFISAFVIFASSMTAVLGALLGFREEVETYVSGKVKLNLFDFFISHYSILCLIFVVLGSIYFISAVNLLKRKNWARLFLIWFSGILIIIVIVFWFQIISWSQFFDSKGLVASAIIAILVCALPLTGLIFFLQTKKVRDIFKGDSNKVHIYNPER